MIQTKISFFVSKVWKTQFSIPSNTRAWFSYFLPGRRKDAPESPRTFYSDSQRLFPVPKDLVKLFYCLGASCVPNSFYVHQLLIRCGLLVGKAGLYLLLI